MRAVLRTTHHPVELSRDELWHLQLDVTDVPWDSVVDQHARLSDAASEIALVEERSFAVVDFDDRVAA